MIALVASKVVSAAVIITKATPEVIVSSGDFVVSAMVRAMMEAIQATPAILTNWIGTCFFLR